MKYTNKYKLPTPIRLWLERDNYDYHPGIYSATRLMKPVRMVVLEERFAKELEMDISDTIASRYGTALHDSLEMIEIPNALQEERMFGEVGGFKVSGKPDILLKAKFGFDPLTLTPTVTDDTYELWDLKSTSVWTYIYGSRDEEHKIQLSIYKLLAEQNGFAMYHRGVISYLFTDWSRSRARQGGDYPPIRAAIKQIDLMDTVDTEQYITSRINLFNAHMEMAESDLPLCTRKELWQKDDKWAIMKEGRKSAVKLHDNETDAKKHLETFDDKHSIEHRPGVVNRCDYCVVTGHCSQFTDLVAQGLVNGD